MKCNLFLSIYETTIWEKINLIYIFKIFLHAMPETRSLFELQVHKPQKNKGKIKPRRLCHIYFILLLITVKCK